MASPVLCLHEVEYLWAKCWTDQTLSVLELKIRWGRSFASLSLFMQWPCDCGLYGVIRNVVLGMRWTWALLLPKTFQTVYVLELWCEDGRDDSNIQGKSCEGSVCEVGSCNCVACCVFTGCSRGCCGSVQESRATEPSPRHVGFDWHEVCCPVPLCGLDWSEQQRNCPDSIEGEGQMEDVHGDSKGKA